jgi:hypothetical protein
VLLCYKKWLLTDIFSVLPYRRLYWLPPVQSLVWALT